MSEKFTPSSTHIQIARDRDFTKLVYDVEGPYNTELQLTRNDMPDDVWNTTVYMRAAHSCFEIGKSPWSRVKSLNIQAPAEVVGICLNNNDTERKGFFRWIDEKGNELGVFDYYKYPIFNMMQSVSTDIERGTPVELLQIPKVYIKTSTEGVKDTYSEGKKCWWISDLPLAGFRLHPAFKRAGRNLDHVSIGKYVAFADKIDGGTLDTLGSYKNQVVKTNLSLSEANKLIKARNNDVDVSGFRSFDIWDRSLLTLLYIVMKADADSQRVLGNNVDMVENPNTGTTNAKMVFSEVSDTPLFIDDLFGGYWTLMDKMTVSNSLVSLQSPLNDTAAITFNYESFLDFTLPNTNNGVEWIRDVLSCPFQLGDDTHDLMELFIPKETSPDENMGTFTDGLISNSDIEQIPRSGGPYQNGTTKNMVGIFSMDVTTDKDTINAQSVARICKN